MIGGYAQLSYGFNYYGTIGTNRDEFVVVRKMNKVDWLDGEGLPPPAHKEHTHEDPRSNRHGPESGQVHWLPHLLGDLQERLDQSPWRRVRLVQQRRKRSLALVTPRNGKTRASGTAAGCVSPTAPSSPAKAASSSLLDEASSPTRTCRDRRLLRALHLRLRAPAKRAQSRRPRPPRAPAA